MGLFGKWIPDRQRVETVSPSLKTLLLQLAKYDQAVFDDSWEDQIAAIESMPTLTLSSLSCLRSPLSRGPDCHLAPVQTRPPTPPLH